MRINKFMVAAIVACAWVPALAFTATPAAAATPGSACDIHATGPEGSRVDAPGTVSANGLLCVPNTPIVELPELNAGVPCGTLVQVANFFVRATCPS